MGPSARKSSIGGRRGPVKAHIPYRGDNPDVGKKTGIAVQYVERKSDGFEPFDEVIGQADGRTPPRPKGKKKSMPRYTDEDDEEDDYYEEEEEYGEISMEVDSPIQNIANLRAPVTPTNMRTAARPVARTSTVDFDKIPSPRNRSRDQSTAGPSKLRRSTIVEEREPSSEPHEEEHYEEDDTMQLGGDDYNEPQQQGRSSPEQTSFTQMDQDDDSDNEPFNETFNETINETFDDPGHAMEEEEVEEEQPPEEETPRPAKWKGKGKAREEEPVYDDHDMEDDVAQELEQIQPSEDEEPEREPTPQPKKRKVRISDQEPPRRKNTSTSSKKENRPAGREGVRRSTREHYKPLEWWRGEKVVYGRIDFQQPVLVPQIREIVRIPKETPDPLSHKRKRGRSRSRTVQPQPQQPEAPVNPEEGWDKDTEPNAVVLGYRDGEEVEKRIAWTDAMVELKKVQKGDWGFVKTLSDDDFFAAGQIVIPPKCRKPSKRTKDNSYIFYVIEGAVNLKIHKTSMVLATGAMFLVPRGNTYFIENISQRDARLFFTQARKTMNDEEERAVAMANRESRVRKARRSSSGGARRSESVGTPGASDLGGLGAKRKKETRA